MLSPRIPVIRQSKYWTDFIQSYIEKNDPHQFHIDKLHQRGIIRLANLPQPKLLFIGPKLTEENIESLPETFVAKLSEGSSTKAVWVVKKEGDSMLELLRRNHYTVPLLCAEIREAAKTSRALVLVEEYFPGDAGRGGHIPRDYKFYTFQQGVEMVVVIDRNSGTRFQLLNKMGRPVKAETAHLHKGEAIHAAQRDRVPCNFRQMVTAATKLVRMTRVPFMSVDMFTNGFDFRVGEITLRPGGPFYGESFRLSESTDLEWGRLTRETYKQNRWKIPWVAENSPAVRKRIQSEGN